MCIWLIYDAAGEEQKTYQYSDDNNLYLKELDKRSYYQDCININLYRKEEEKPLELNLVYLTASAIDKKDIITEDSNYINVTAIRNSSVENDEYVASY